MRDTPYTACVLRYVHDSIAEESLNIGVILFAPDNAFIEVRWERHYSRLSAAFAEFNGEHYRKTLLRFDSSLAQIRDRVNAQKPSLIVDPRRVPSDASEVVMRIWPDQGLSFRAGAMMCGVTREPSETLETLFTKLVSSQYTKEQHERRTDEDVYIGTYRELLVQHRISKQLEPVKIATEEIELEFPHAFKNGAWHVLQPVSMDYVRPQSITKKATEWLGAGTALRKAEKLGTLYLLLGAPTQSSHRDAYEKAKRLLNDIPVKKRVIDEDEAPKFVGELADYMYSHGLVEGQEPDPET